jgi:hypothetical protein
MFKFNKYHRIYFYKMSSTEQNSREAFAILTNMSNNNGKELLLKDLEAKPQGFARDHILYVVENGGFYDFHSSYHPLTSLVYHLEACGYTDMVAKAKLGLYL